MEKMKLINLINFFILLIGIILMLFSAFLVDFGIMPNKIGALFLILIAATRGIEIIFLKQKRNYFNILLFLIFLIAGFIYLIKQY